MLKRGTQSDFVTHHLVFFCVTSSFSVFVVPLLILVFTWVVQSPCGVHWALHTEIWVNTDSQIG